MALSKYSGTGIGFSGGFGSAMPFTPTTAGGFPLIVIKQRSKETISSLVSSVLEKKRSFSPMIRPAGDRETQPAVSCKPDTHFRRLKRKRSHEDPIGLPKMPYVPLTRIRIPKFYAIRFGNKYAKIDSSGWLAVTDNFIEAALFTDVYMESGTEVIVKVVFSEYSDRSWLGLDYYLGKSWLFKNSVGVFRSFACDPMRFRWYRGHQLIPLKGSATEQNLSLVYRKSDGYLYFHESAGSLASEYVRMTGKMNLNLGSMVSVFQLLWHKHAGTITRRKAAERYRQMPVTVGGYKQQPVTVYRATDKEWDQTAIESGTLISKFMYQTYVAQRTGRMHTSVEKIGPIVTPDMVADPHNMDVLGMRILAMGSSDEPMSQFVSVACNFEVASRFGQRVYSFDVIPNGPLLAENDECQYQILGGTNITNVVIERF